MQDASCTVPGDIRATFVRLLAYMGALAILAMAAASLFRTPAGIAAIRPAPLPEWINVGHPRPAFDMQMPELAAQGFDYAILRRNADNARKDVLSWGEPTGSGPYVLIEIYRPGAASERFIDAPSEIAARIVGFTITDDVKPAGQIDSKGVSAMSAPQLYDTIGTTYTVTRRTEPRIAAQVWAALGEASTVLNVGAGAGSYEPPDRHVTAVEPSACPLSMSMMRSSRRVHNVS